MSEHRHGPGGHRHGHEHGCSGHTHAHGQPSAGADLPNSSDESHRHADDHDHDHTAGASGGILAAAFGLTALFMLVEFAGGLLASSLALMADAGHMLTD